MGVTVVTGRIVRRFSVYSHFYFIELRIPYINDQLNTSFPIIIKSHVLAVGSYPRIRVGDVVRITGQIECDISEHYKNKCFSASSIELVEKWDSDRYGPFQFTPPWKHHDGGRHFAHNRVELGKDEKRRNFFAAIQCQIDVFDRMLCYLREVYGEIVEFEVNTSPITICQDRLILLYARCSSQSGVVIEKILDDRIITYALSRIYWFGHDDDLIIASTLTELSECISKRVVGEKNSTVRMHAFPKFIPVENFARACITSSPPGAITFNPRVYDHILAIVYANGLWYASLCPSNEAIGSGRHLYKGGSIECLNVSKASQKLFEAIRRMPGLGFGGINLKGKTCIDIGASPGGWSYYMAIECGASRVIAVDNGALAEPKPESVEHWKMRGEDAIDRLVKDTEKPQIYMYTCDMNVDPMITTSLFLSAIPLMEPRGCFTVLTFKRTIKNKIKWESRKMECMAKLKDELSDRLTRIVELHLIANTPNETSVLLQLTCAS